MKYNIQSLINDFLKLLKWWYLLLLIICYGNFLYLNFSQKVFEITRIDFLSSLGIFYTLGEFTSINKLLFIFTQKNKGKTNLKSSLYFYFIKNYQSTLKQMCRPNVLVLNHELPK